MRKIRFTNPMSSKHPSTLWIDTARGLPVFHDVEDTGPGGFARVYGAAVKGPSSTP